MFLALAAAAVAVVSGIHYMGISSERARLIRQAATVGTARYVIDPVTGSSKAVWVLPNGATEDIE